MAHGVFGGFRYSRQWVWEGHASQPPLWDHWGDGGVGGGLHCVGVQGCHRVSVCHGHGVTSSWYSGVGVSWYRGVDTAFEEARNSHP
jgi:hypothetical protein